MYLNQLMRAFLRGLMQTCILSCAQGTEAGTGKKFFVSNSR